MSVSYAQTDSILNVPYLGEISVLSPKGKKLHSCSCVVYADDINYGETWIVTPAICLEGLKRKGSINIIMASDTSVVFNRKVLGQYENTASRFVMVSVDLLDSVPNVSELDAVGQYKRKAAISLINPFSNRNVPVKTGVMKGKRNFLLDRYSVDHGDAGAAVIDTNNKLLGIVTCGYSGKYLEIATIEDIEKLYFEINFDMDR